MDRFADISLCIGACGVSEKPSPTVPQVDVDPPDERLQAIRERRQQLAAIRAAFAERRAYGIAARHRNKLARNRKEDPS